MNERNVKSEKVFLISVFILSLFFSLISSFFFIYLSSVVAPLNEEDWLFKKRDFVVGFKDGEVFYNSENKANSTARKLGFSISQRFIGFVERDLPPKLSFVIDGYVDIPLLGWGHVGPVSLIPLSLFSKLVYDFLHVTDIFPPVFVFRMLNIILLIFFYPIFLILTLRKIFLIYCGRYSDESFLFSKPYSFFVYYAFFLSFPINIFFVSAATFWYLIMSILAPISFMFLVQKNFKSFFLTTSLIIATHLRGVVIFASFFIFFILAELLSSHNDTRRKNIKAFLISSIVYSPLIFFSLFIYIIPDIIPDKNLQFDLGGESAISFHDIIKTFSLKLIEKIPLIFQFVIMRLGDFFISGNIFALLRELGIISEKNNLFVFSSILSTVFYFIPAFFYSKNFPDFYKNLLIFLGVYFVLSIFAVPFFVGMPWQFLPIHFIPLFLSSITLSNFRGSLLLPALSGIFTIILGSLNLENLVRPFALWKEHEKLGRFLVSVIQEVKKEREDAGREDLAEKNGREAGRHREEGKNSKGESRNSNDNDGNNDEDNNYVGYGKNEGDEKDFRGKKIDGMEILCIVKSDILFVFRDCDKANFLFLLQEFRFGKFSPQNYHQKRETIISFFRKYQFVVLSYHFFWMKDLLGHDFEVIYRSPAFLVFRALVEN